MNAYFRQYLLFCVIATSLGEFENNIELEYAFLLLEFPAYDDVCFSRSDYYN